MNNYFNLSQLSQHENQITPRYNDVDVNDGDIGEQISALSDFDR